MSMPLRYAGLTRTARVALAACLLPLQATAVDLDGLTRVTLQAPDAPCLGAAGAPVVMVEFTDYQCPYCRAFARQLLPKLVREFVDGGRLKIVIADLPLAMHEAAFPAAMAAHCAGRQGAYWDMHHWLFSGPATLTAAAMRARVIALDLDPEAFEACLQDPGTAAAIEADIALARGIGVTATPSFVIGRERDGGIEGVLLKGLTPYGVYGELIRRELAAAAPGAGGGGAG